jgi:beta-lactamase superfamily II metal-dependent hydrolase
MRSLITMAQRLPLLFVLTAAFLCGQANGKLQLHFIDVGQGDGALMITPGGKVALFDAGMDLGVENCTKITSPR